MLYLNAMYLFKTDAHHIFCVLNGVFSIVRPQCVSSMCPQCVSSMCVLNCVLNVCPQLNERPQRTFHCVSSIVRSNDYGCLSSVCIQ